MSYNTFIDKKVNPIRVNPVSKCQRIKKEGSTGRKNEQEKKHSQDFKEIFEMNMEKQKNK